MFFAHWYRPNEQIIQIHLVQKKLSSEKVINSMRDTTRFYKPCENRARFGTGDLQIEKSTQLSCGLLWHFLFWWCMEETWVDMSQSFFFFFFVSLHLSELAIALSNSVPQVKSRKKNKNFKNLRAYSFIMRGKKGRRKKKRTLKCWMVSHSIC